MLRCFGRDKHVRHAHKCSCGDSAHTSRSKGDGTGQEVLLSRLARKRMVLAEVETEISLLTLPSSSDSPAGVDILYQNVPAILFSQCLKESASGEGFLCGLFSLEPHLLNEMLECVLSGQPWTAVVRVPALPSTENPWASEQQAPVTESKVVIDQAVATVQPLTSSLPEMQSTTDHRDLQQEQQRETTLKVQQQSPLKQLLADMASVAPSRSNHSVTFALPDGPGESSGGKYKDLLLRAASETSSRNSVEGLRATRLSTSLRCASRMRSYTSGSSGHGHNSAGSNKSHVPHVAPAISKPPVIGRISHTRDSDTRTSATSRHAAANLAQLISSERTSNGDVSVDDMLLHVSALSCSTGRRNALSSRKVLSLIKYASESRRCSITGPTAQGAGSLRRGGSHFLAVSPTNSPVAAATSSHSEYLLTSPFQWPDSDGSLGAERTSARSATTSPLFVARRERPESGSAATGLMILGTDSPPDSPRGSGAVPKRQTLPGTFTATREPLPRRLSSQMQMTPILSRATPREIPSTSSPALHAAGHLATSPGSRGGSPATPEAPPHRLSSRFLNFDAAAAHSQPLETRLSGTTASSGRGNNTLSMLGTAPAGPASATSLGPLSVHSSFNDVRFSAFSGSFNETRQSPAESLPHVSENMPFPLDMLPDVDEEQAPPTPSITQTTQRMVVSSDAGGQQPGTAAAAAAAAGGASGSGTNVLGSSNASDWCSGSLGPLGSGLGRSSAQAAVALEASQPRMSEELLITANMDHMMLSTGARASLAHVESTAEVAQSAAGMINLELVENFRQAVQESSGDGSGHVPPVLSRGPASNADAPRSSATSGARASAERAAEEGQGAEEGEYEEEEEEAPCQYHEITAKPVKDPITGGPALLLIQQDVSNRVAAEEALAELTNAQLAVLCNSFPRHVVEFLSVSHPESVQGHIGQLARSHDEVTIMFMDIVGFTSMSRQVPPEAVLTFLNSFFSQLDEICEKHGVQKVDTAGDCYIVACGVMEGCPDSDGFSHVAMQHQDPASSAQRVMECAKDIMRCAHNVRMPHDGSPVVIRIGLHTGPCVSGLIGTKQPKFSLFGDTMNTASRMESTSLPGRIQVSAATHTLLAAPPRSNGGYTCQGSWQPTGGIDVKGKGIMQTYLWEAPDSWLYEGFALQTTLGHFHGRLQQVVEEERERASSEGLQGEPSLSLEHQAQQAHPEGEGSKQCDGQAAVAAFSHTGLPQTSPAGAHTLPVQQAQQAQQYATAMHRQNLAQAQTDDSATSYTQRAGQQGTACDQQRRLPRDSAQQLTQPPQEAPAAAAQKPAASLGIWKQLSWRLVGALKADKDARDSKCDLDKRDKQASPSLRAALSSHSSSRSASPSPLKRVHSGSDVSRGRASPGRAITPQRFGLEDRCSRHSPARLASVGTQAQGPVAATPRVQHQQLLQGSAAAPAAQAVGTDAKPTAGVPLVQAPAPAIPQPTHATYTVSAVPSAADVTSVGQAAAKAAAATVQDTTHLRAKHRCSDGSSHGGGNFFLRPPNGSALSTSNNGSVPAAAHGPLLPAGNPLHHSHFHHIPPHARQGGEHPQPHPTAHHEHHTHHLTHHGDRAGALATVCRLTTSINMYMVASASHAGSDNGDSDGTSAGMLPRPTASNPGHRQGAGRKSLDLAAPHPAPSNLRRQSIDAGPASRTAMHALSGRPPRITRRSIDYGFNARVGVPAGSHHYTVAQHPAVSNVSAKPPLPVRKSTEVTGYSKLAAMPKPERQPSAPVSFPDTDLFPTQQNPVVKHPYTNQPLVI